MRRELKWHGVKGLGLHCVCSGELLPGSNAGEETYRSQERQETGFIIEISDKDPHTDC